MSAMSDQHIIVCEAISSTTHIPFETIQQLEFTVWDIVSAQDDEFVWHVSFDERLYKVVTGKTQAKSIVRIR